MFKKILFLFLLVNLNLYSVFANNVEVEVEPQTPTVGENFSINFIIESNSSEEPYISFETSNGQVLGKSNSGVSVTTTMINGKLETKRKSTYTYEVVAEREGTLIVKNIEIDFNGQKQRVKDFSVKVYKEAPRPKEIFMLAVPSKTKVYVGEGVDINYYIYSRLPITGFEIADFPKLNGFIKRYHEPPANNLETVNYNGIVFKRMLRYTARAYPQRSGTLTIDPFKLKVQYIESSGSNFGFGLGFQQQKVRDLSSPPEKIEVIPLPATSVPKNFSGLVGQHKFRLNVPNNKFLVNEAIELKLEVEGPGALENFDPPAFYEQKELEFFDSKSELVEVDWVSARRTFDITYLAKAPGVIPAGAKKISIFNPDTEKYEEVEVSLPELTISGQASASVTASADNTENDGAKLGNTATTPVQIEAPLELLAPRFGRDSIKNGLAEHLNLILLIILILVLLSFLNFDAIRKNDFDRKVDQLKKDIVKGNNQYSKLRQLICCLEDDGSKTGIPETALKKSALPQDVKQYFVRTLSAFEQKEFKGKAGIPVEVSKNQLNTLVKFIRHRPRVANDSYIE